jgi:hypothetical protein
MPSQRGKGSLRSFLQQARRARISTDIVSPVLMEADPPFGLYRLWRLLSDALVELAEDREKSFDFLAAIQPLPPYTCIAWSHLGSLGHMRSGLSACICMVGIRGRRRTRLTLANSSSIITSKPLGEQRPGYFFVV